MPAPAVEARLEEPALQRAAQQRDDAPAGATALRMLAPAATAVLAFLMHRYATTRPGDAANTYYPFVLAAWFVAALVIAGLQRFWGRLRTWAHYYAPLMTGAVALMLAWDLITTKLDWMPLPYFPGPDAVLAGLVTEWALLLENTYFTLRLLAVSYLSGVFLGLISGVLMGWFGHARYWGVPVMKVLGPVPATALVPLAMFAFADPFFPGAALIAWAVWFPVTMLTMSGIANVPAIYFDVARTLGAGRMFLIFRVAIPAAMPTIFIGLFIGLTVSFLIVPVAETVGVRNGLGWYLKWQQGYARYDNVYASLVIMAAFFSSIMTLLFRVRDWVLSWQKGVIRW